MRSRLPELRRIITRGTYVPSVDGIRFIAILLVLVGHAFSRVIRRSGDVYPQIANSHYLSFWDQGRTGVGVFFGLSGYILYAGLARALGKDGKYQAGYVKKYFARRISRIEPPYLIVMTLLFAGLATTGFVSKFAAASGRTDIPLGESFAASFFYLHNLVFGALPRINPPAWSLEVEVQFYVLAPLFTLGIFALRRKFNRFAMAVIAMLTLVWAYVIYNLLAGCPVADRNSLLRHFPFFISGILVFEAEQEAPSLLPRGKVADLLAVLGFPSLIVISGLSETLGAIDIWLMSLALYFLIAGALHGHYVKRAASVAWVATLGGMCYSIYLVHLPVFEAVASKINPILRGTTFPLYFTVQFVLLTVCALAAAFVMYVLIERPCMNPAWPSSLWRRLHSSGGSRPEEDA